MLQSSLRQLFCFFLLLSLVSGFAFELDRVKFKVLYCSDVSWDEGKVSVTPQSAGAAFLYLFPDTSDFSEFNSCQIDFATLPEGLQLEDFALSIRGEEHVYVLPSKDSQPLKQKYQWEKKLNSVKQIRIYFNRKKKLDELPSTLELQRCLFFLETSHESESADLPLSSIAIPRRERLSASTLLFPRIQSKYDLMKNYLGAYSKGSGTFMDRPLFFDRGLGEQPLPLYDKLNSLESFDKQLQVALMFTDGLGSIVSARVQRFFSLLDFAEAKGRQNVILLEQTPNAFLDLQRSRVFIDRALASPSVLKLNGRLLISSYHGDSGGFTPEKWQQTIAPLRQMYPDKLYFMIELRGLAYRINALYNKNQGLLKNSEVEQFKEYARSYLRVGDGINFSGSNHITAKADGFPELVFNAEAYKNFIVPIFTSVVNEPEFAGNKLLGLSAHKVYCQVRNTLSNVDEQGTLSLRRSLQIALAANPDYIVMPEWNEVNEHTHLEPVVSDAMASARVVNAITGLKAVPDVERELPNLVLSFRQENDLAAPIPIELLSLPDENPSNFSVTLRLYDQKDQLVKEFEQVSFNAREIESRFYFEEAKQFSQSRFLYPELLIKQGEKTYTVCEGLPHLRLLSANNPWHRYVKIPLRDLPSSETISGEFSFVGDEVLLRGTVETPEKISSIELMADDIPLAAWDPRGEYAPLAGYELLCWRRQVPVFPGYNNDEIQISALSGKIKLRQPHQYGLAGMASPELHGQVLRGKVGGGSSLRELYFYASPDAELELLHRGSTAQVSVSEVIKNQRWRHCQDAGVSWQLLTLPELPELPFPIDQRKVDYELSAKLSSAPNPVYYLRVVTREGRVFRGKPQLSKAFTGEQRRLPIWNLLTDQAEEISVAKELTRQIDYDFNPRLNHLLPDKGDCRNYDAILGGFDYWTHSSPMGWNFPLPPQWFKDAEHDWVLRFTPGSYILLPPPIFSKSAFELQMEFRLHDLEEQSLLGAAGQQFSLSVKNARLQGSIATSKTELSWSSNAALQVGLWYRLRLKYDLQTLQVLINDLIVAEMPAHGVFSRAWFMSIGGQPLEKARNPQQSQVPDPKLLAELERRKTAPDPGFNLRADLRALRISNAF